MSNPKYDIDVTLTGVNGNAFAIIGTVTKALTRAGVSQDEIKEFTTEATSGDYDNVLVTCMKWVNVS